MGFRWVCWPSSNNFLLFSFTLSSSLPIEKSHKEDEEAKLTKGRSHQEEENDTKILLLELVVTIIFFIYFFLI